MNERRNKAIIIGCGLAGPALAIFLKRAGIEAEIYEARAAAEGFALSLSCNGVAVLKELGLDRAAMEEGSAVTGWQMWNGNGKYLGEGVLAGAGNKSVFIKRIPLGTILSEEAERQGIKIVRGKKLSQIETASQDGVTAVFQDGTTATGDFLIGCDGVHSRTRQIIFPTFPGAVYSGLINSGGYTSGVELPGPPATINFIFGRRAFFGYHVSPTGYAYWFVNWPQTEKPARGAYDELGNEERKQQLSQLFQEDPPFIRKMIQASESTFPYFASYSIPVQPEAWHKGKVALLGDAAHAISPSSGQGASMALEDAIVLAKCLRDIPDHEQAFKVYERLRRERTAKMFEVGQRGDSGKHAVRPIQQWLRDLMTPVFLKLFASPKASDWMYAYKVDWETRISS